MTSVASEHDQLWAALDQPGCVDGVLWFTLGLIADDMPSDQPWAEECLRWCVANRKKPVDPGDSEGQWEWWHSAGWADSCRITTPLWNHFGRRDTIDTYSWGDTLSHAYQRLCAAWTSLRQRGIDPNE